MDYLYFTKSCISSTGLMLICSLITIYLLSIKNKDKSTWMLVFFFLFNSLFFLRNILLFSSLNYNLSIILQIGIILVSISNFFLVPFSLFIYKDFNEKITKVILIISTAILFGAIIFQIFFALTQPTMGYNFQVGQYSFFGGFRVNINGIYSIFYIVAISVFLMKTILFSESKENVFKKILFPKGKYTRACRNFCICIFLTSSMGIFGIIILLGLIEYGTAILIIHTLTLFLFFLYTLTYLQASPHPSTIMTKILGITLIAFLIIFTNIGSHIIDLEENIYERERQSDLKMIKTILLRNMKHGIKMSTFTDSDLSMIPDSLIYIAERSAVTSSKTDNYKLIYNKQNGVTEGVLTGSNNDLIIKLGMSSADSAKAGPIFTKKTNKIISIKNPNTFFKIYNFNIDNTIYELGYNYLDYRKKINFPSLITLLSLFLFCIFIIIIFPLFFKAVLLKPLGELLNGVKKVNDGDLSAFVHVNVNDEIGFLSDSFNNMVSSVKNVQSELQYYVENLEFEVKNRTSELKQANEQLKEMDKIKTNFFANISHEIRTPLTLIITPIESAIQGDYNKPVDRYFLENLKSNSNRLLALINDLLDFSKIEAGRMSIKVKEIDIVKFIDVFIGTVQSAADSKEIKIVLRSECDSLYLFLDTDKMEKIIMNLLSNAFKFTNKGDTIIITIKDEDSNCSIEVEDTGQGIPEKNIEYIFDRFSQGDPSSTRKHEGTGIGLALVKEFVEMQGGSISVESRHIKKSPENHGSIFKITFPKGKDHFNKLENVEFIKNDETTISEKMVHAEVVDNIERVIQVDNEDGIKIDYEMDYTVLIVEDNPDMVNLLSEILNKNYNTLNASNGKEALDILNSEVYEVDLILADVMMPEMDGRELLSLVRKNKNFIGIPFIFLTAKAEMPDKLHGFEIGATDYIQKPFNTRELVARLKAQLEMKSLRDKLKRTNQKLYEQLRKKGSASAPLSNQSEEKIKSVIEFIDDNFDTDINRESLASAVDMNADHLSRVFNQYTGKKLNEYINDLRIEEAKRMLLNTKHNITDIAYSVGFDNLRTFNRLFNKSTGISPREFRNKDAVSLTV